MNRYINKGRKPQPAPVSTLALLWLLIMALLVLGLNRPWQAHSAPDDWVWVSCDVGQGDAHLVRTGDTAATLIDTGESYRLLQDCLHWAGVKQIDSLFITHQHRDHYGATPELLAHYPVDHIYTPPTFDGTLLGELPPATGHSEIGLQHHDQPLTLDLGARAHATLIWPPADPTLIPGEPGSNILINNSSLVLHLSLTSTNSHTLSLLTTGDIEQEVARRLARTEEVKADVLKVPHHGSKGSGTELIGSTHPAIALIPVGASNDYGHPHATITNHLTIQGITTYRTDTHGHIALVPRGSTITVFTSH